MSKSTETPSSTTDDPGEVERLRSHNSNLLAELKAAKAKATALQGQLDAASEERDTAREEVRALRLAPVRDLLERIAMPGTSDLLQRMLGERGITFDLDGDQIVIRDADGNPATVTDPPTRTAALPKPRPAKFEERDLMLLMTEEGVPERDRHALSAAFPRFLRGTRSSGGGSQGGAGDTPSAAPDKPDNKPTSAPKAFGLI